jgi:Zn finger protein HypA/HybF involved in hydrogenase expression
MIILDNKKEIPCKQCNEKEITYNMFIFNNLLYCFKCSMEKLKINKKRY